VGQEPRGGLEAQELQRPRARIAEGRRRGEGMSADRKQIRRYGYTQRYGAVGETLGFSQESQQPEEQKDVLRLRQGWGLI